MTKSFASYQIENQTDKPSEILIRFFDMQHKLIAETKLPKIEFSEISENIRNSKTIDLENVFVANFSLKEYQDLNLHLLKCTAENVFFENKTEKIDLSKLHITAPNIAFSNCIFSADEISFSGTVFNSKSTSFDGCRFYFSDEISFQKCEFVGSTNFKHAAFSKGTKNFKTITFANEQVDFTDTDFGDGDLSFSGTNFGNGKISFKIANFGNGRTDFSETEFGTNEATFEKAEFGNGDVTFRNTKFLSKYLNFISLKFGNGKKDFSNASLGLENVTFKNSNFGNGKISFRQANFGAGIVDFHYCEFGNGDLIFDSAMFKSGTINFRTTNFGDGAVSFKRTNFGDGELNFQASTQKSGTFRFENAVLGNGEFNFEDTDFSNTDVTFFDVDFGSGKVTLRNSLLQTLSLNNSVLANYFDLRIQSCELLDLSDTIVKDIVDLAPYDRPIRIKNIKLSGMRLLGRLYLDWNLSNVKELIYKQQTTHRDRKEQFRILKENYSSNGQYAFEDEAYVEFKRCEAKAKLEVESQKSIYKRFKANFSYGFNLLILDKMGRYATSPLRVLTTMFVTYLAFTLSYIFLSMYGNSHILSSLFPAEDPRILGLTARAFYHSAITFLTIGYGDYYPDGIARWISSAEGFIGLFLMSYFTVAFARKALR